MGLVYGFTAIAVLHEKISTTPLQILLWAVILRLILLPSVPILETDYYRYLWDGYVTSHGVNPFRYAPADFKQEPKPNQNDSDEDLNRLYLSIQQSERAQEVLQNINHPQIRTIYPAFTQIVFAISNVFFPLSLIGWRLFVIFFDLVLILCLILLLPKFGFSANRVIFYAWSPLVLKEYINTTHIDGIALSMFFLTVLLFTTSQLGRAGAAFACSIMTKFFMLPLIPIWYRKLRGIGLGWFLIVLAVLLFLFMTPGEHETEALAHFAQRWESNSSLVQVFERILIWLGLPEWQNGVFWFEWGGVNFNWDAFIVANGILTLVFFCFVGWFTWKSIRLDDDNELPLLYFSFSRIFLG